MHATRKPVQDGCQDNLGTPAKKAGCGLKPYRTDLAPSDVHLFGSLRAVLRKKHFQSHPGGNDQVQKWIPYEIKEFCTIGVYKLLTLKTGSRCILASSTNNKLSNKTYFIYISYLLTSWRRKRTQICFLCYLIEKTHFQQSYSIKVASCRTM